MLNCIIIACSAFQRLSYNPSPYIGLVRGMQLCCAIVSHQYWILAQNSLVKFSTDLEAIVSCRPALPGSSSIWADWKPCCRIASAVAAEGSRQSSRPMCSAASPCRSACDHDFDLIQKKRRAISNAAAIGRPVCQPCVLVELALHKKCEWIQEKKENGD